MSTSLWKIYGSLRPCGRGLYLNNALIPSRRALGAVLPSRSMGSQPARLTEDEISSRARELISRFSEEAGKGDMSKIQDSGAHFMNDLGFDSLDTVEIINAFEEEFDVTIPDHEAEKMWTIGDAAKFIAQNHH